MVKKKNGRENYLKYLSIIILSSSFIYSIMSSEFLTEAQKYFAITLLLLAFIVGYIKFIIEK